MTLYEIDEAILECIDQESGEIIDENRLNALQLDRENKVEAVALWIKDLKAENNALKAEIDNLKSRAATNERKSESLEKWLTGALNGEKFKTAKCSVSYRSSTVCEVDPEFIEWAKHNATELLRYKEPEADKTKIKEILADGITLPYAGLVSKTSTIIK